MLKGKSKAITMRGFTIKDDDRVFFFHGGYLWDRKQFSIVISI